MTEIDKINELDKQINKLKTDRQLYVSSLGLKDLINSVPDLNELKLNTSCCIQNFGVEEVNGVLREVNYDVDNDKYLLKFDKAVVINTRLNSVTYHDDFGARYVFKVNPGYPKGYRLITEDEFDNDLKWKFKSFKYMIKNIRENADKVI